MNNKNYIDFPLIEIPKLKKILEELNNNRTIDYFKDVFCHQYVDLIKKSRKIKIIENYFETDSSLIESEIENENEIWKQLIRSISLSQYKKMEDYFFSAENEENYDLGIELFVDMFKENMYHKNYLSISEYNLLHHMIILITGNFEFFESILNPQKPKKTVADLIGKDNLKLLDYPLVLFTYGDIGLVSDPKKLEDLQLGIRIDKNTGEIADKWPNEKYVIVGIDTSSGADEAYILVDTSNKKRPVLLFDPYYLGPDSAPYVICDSLDKLIPILDVLKKYEPKFDSISGLSKKDREDVKEKIREITGKKEISAFWLSLIQDYKNKK